MPCIPDFNAGPSFKLTAHKPSALWGEMVLPQELSDTQKALEMQESAKVLGGPKPTPPGLYNRCQQSTWGNWLRPGVQPENVSSGTRRVREMASFPSSTMASALFAGLTCPRWKSVIPRSQMTSAPCLCPPLLSILRHFKCMELPH